MILVKVLPGIELETSNKIIFGVGEYWLTDNEGTLHTINTNEVIDGNFWKIDVDGETLTTNNAGTNSEFWTLQNDELTTV